MAPQTNGLEFAGVRGMRSLAAFLLAFVLPTLAGVARADTILILGAVPQEIVPLQQALAAAASETIDGIPCDVGQIGGHRVILALTGVGKENSVMVTTALLDHYRPRYALMTGTAARIRRTVRTGDVIIVRRVAYHDVGSLTPDGVVTGKLDQAGHLVATPWFGPDRQRSTISEFAPDPGLLALAVDYAGRFAPEPVSLPGLAYVPVVRLGSVVTGDLSGVTDAKIADIRRRFDPDLMEMESAAFAHVCTYLHVPFLIIRSGSNYAEEQNYDDYVRLSPIAARHAAAFTLGLLPSLP
jgi:nucleoside phosphorylase